jgi:hypothetical protein
MTFWTKGRAMMDRKSIYTLGRTFLNLMLLATALPHTIAAQTTTPQPTRLHSKVGPVSLVHLYWHFLTLQNYLDTKSVELGSNGKDESGLRNNLQKQLAWSDEDYAFVRTSSVRLTAELKDLNTQAALIKAAGESSSSHEQLQALTVQRETNINSEITFLKQSLPPDKIRAFETFLIHFFAPKVLSSQPSSTIGSSIAGQPAPTAVQK